MRIFLRIGVLSLMCSVVPGFAAILNFQFSATGSGEVGGAVFTNSAFQISGLFDTANVQALADDYFRVELTDPRLNAGGALADVAILGVVRAIVGPGEAGIFKSGANLYFIGADFSVTGYELNGPAGPYTAPPFAGPDEFLDTALGEFRISSLSGEATFEVTPSGVPEPASFGMAALGVLAIMAARNRGR